MLRWLLHWSSSSSDTSKTWNPITHRGTGNWQLGKLHVLAAVASDKSRFSPAGPDTRSEVTVTVGPRAAAAGAGKIQVYSSWPTGKPGAELDCRQAGQTESPCRTASLSHGSSSAGVHSGWGAGLAGSRPAACVPAQYPCQRPAACRRRAPGTAGPTPLLHSGLSEAWVTTPRRQRPHGHRYPPARITVSPPAAGRPRLNSATWRSEPEPAARSPWRLDLSPSRPGGPGRTLAARAGTITVTRRRTVTGSLAGSGPCLRPTGPAGHASAAGHPGRDSQFPRRPAQAQVAAIRGMITELGSHSGCRPSRESWHGFNLASSASAMIPKFKFWLGLKALRGAPAHPRRGLSSGRGRKKQFNICTKDGISCNGGFCSQNLRIFRK